MFCGIWSRFRPRKWPLVFLPRNSGVGITLSKGIGSFDGPASGSFTTGRGGSGRSGTGTAGCALYSGHARRIYSANSAFIRSRYSLKSRSFSDLYLLKSENARCLYSSNVWAYAVYLQKSRSDDIIVAILIYRLFILFNILAGVSKFAGQFCT